MNPQDDAVIEVSVLDTDQQADRLDDADLIRRSKEDLIHFQPLYQKWLPPVYRYFYHRVGNRQEAEDLTAQVFLKVVEKLPAYRHRGHFPAWLFTIARHLAADFFRNRVASVSLEAVDLVDSGPELLSQAAASDEIHRLRELISTLPENDQELIRLRFVVGLSYTEMSKLLNRKEDTVRKYLSRLLARMQNQLEMSHE